MKKFFKDFKAFISRGNILDLAVGVIIGGAFSAIVTAFTNKILMPIINLALAAIAGEGGLEKAYTFLRKVMTFDAEGNEVVDLAKSIYIDWGAFITAVIDFLLIALVLFLIVKFMMNAQQMSQKAKEGRPTKEEKAELKAQGVDMKDRKAVKAATLALRESKKPAPEPAKPTEAELLQAILDEMKKDKSEKPKTEKKK